MFQARKCLRKTVHCPVINFLLPHAPIEAALLNDFGHIPTIRSANK